MTSGSDDEKARRQGDKKFDHPVAFSLTGFQKAKAANVTIE
jgi:hypothetical protein